MEQTNTTDNVVSNEADEAIILDDDQSQATEDTADTAEATTENTQSDTTSQDESVNAPSTGDNDVNLEWLAKTKGVDVNDPKAVAEAWRKAEQEFHKTRQQTSTKLKDAAGEAVTTGDELADQIRLLQVQSNIRDFEDKLRDEGLKKADIEAIKDDVADVLVAKPYLAGDLEAAYAIVNSSRTSKLIEEAKNQGREEAKAEIARASSSAMPKGNASGNTRKEEVDPGLAAFDAAF